VPHGRGTLRNPRAKGMGDIMPNKGGKKRKSLRQGGEVRVGKGSRPNKVKAKRLRAAA